MTGLIGVSAVAGLLGLDNRAVGRSLLGEPLCVGWIIGALMGDALGGLLVGAWIQLLWVHLLPEGAVTPPDGTVPTAVAVVLVQRLESRVALDHAALVMLVLVVTIPLGFISRWLEIHLKEGLGRMSEWVDVYAYHGQTDKVTRVILWSAGLETMKTAGLTLVASSIGLAVLPRMLASLPQPIIEGLGLAYWFILPLGLAVTLEVFHVTNKLRVFLGSFLVMTVAYVMVQSGRPWLLVAGVAAGWMFVRWNFRANKVTA